MTDFFGNFLLALLLVALIRALYAICGMLIRTGDAGNRLFAMALPAALLYIVISNPVPVTSWAGLMSGAAAGAGVCVSIWRWKRS